MSLNTFHTRDPSPSSGMFVLTETRSLYDRDIPTICPKPFVLLAPTSGFSLELHIQA